MTKDKALQMCLEYIETDKHERKYVRHAIKAALEQAEPPPEWEAINNIIAEYGLQAINFVADWKAALEQPEQEPVACRFCHSKKGCWTWQCYHCGEIDDVQKPTPPAAQRPWQGLTDEKIENIEQKVYTQTIMKSQPRAIYLLKFARAIEAAHGIKENT